MKHKQRGRSKPAGANGRAELERACQCYARRAWADAFQAFVRADEAAPLEAESLELLATTAYLTGRDDDYLGALERACTLHLEAGRSLRAARCAFWLGFRLLFRSETGRAIGWLGRAQRMLEREAGTCAERGYLLLPVVEQRLDAGDLKAAYAAATKAARIGEQCREPDLIASARHQQGRIRLQEGRVPDGLALLDETMVAVAGGELSHIVTGLLYCSVIEACQQVYAIDRTREWTTALTRWCVDQPDMVAFAGTCQVHRSEIMQLQGAWPEAIEEARRACVRSRGVSRQAVAAGLYQQGEVHRLRGERKAAEEAYRDASQHGLEPQPGLALLRAAEGRLDAAATAMRRIACTTTDRLKRLRLLPAYIEIMLAAGDVEDARNACRELEEIVQSLDMEVPRAIAAQACGAVALAEGNARAALGALRPAFEVWQREAPYAAARVRVLIGLACRALGDQDGADLELAAARSEFARLGAAPDLARVDSLIKGGDTPGPNHGLTPRELEVLRLVAEGETNKAVASKLNLSEKTIDRHLSNIFIKLDVSSRTAAAAFAYRHKLV